MTEREERPPITHVAIRWGGKVWSLPKPNRHYDVLRHIRAATGAETVDVESEDDEGFLDASGRYLRRVSAKMSARINGQILPGRGEQRALYSEDLW
jgi:hypothetical protein